MVAEHMLCLSQARTHMLTRTQHMHLIHFHVHLCTHIHKHTCTLTRIIYTHKHTCTHVFSCTRATRMHICTLVRPHSHTHKCTHTWLPVLRLTQPGALVASEGQPRCSPSLELGFLPAPSPSLRCPLYCCGLRSGRASWRVDGRVCASRGK